MGYIASISLTSTGQRFLITAESARMVKRNDMTHSDLIHLRKMTHPDVYTQQIRPQYCHRHVQTLDLSRLLDTPRVTYVGYVVGSIVA